MDRVQSPSSASPTAGSSMADRNEKSSDGNGNSSASPVAVLARTAPRPRERSCIVCHQRKVRCDKGLPCAGCRRTGVLCCYPAKEVARRKRLSGPASETIGEVASRLARLERTLMAVQVSEERKEEQRTRQAQTRTEDPMVSAVGPLPTPTARPIVTKEPTEEILLKDSCRYINEILLSRVLEEEQEIQTMLASLKDSEGGDGDGTLTSAMAPSLAPALSLFGALGGGMGQSSALLPSRSHAMQLWQLYKQNVEPLDKVLHVPTAETMLYTALAEPERVHPNVQGLLFSLYYAAATSCRPEHYKAAFSEDKHAALDRFKAGLECSLAQGNFLEAPTLLSLQALTLFLRLSRAHSPGRSSWILQGTVLRAAQSIGFHRDGERFRLSPFEAEMRRRVWWHLICHDGRAAEDHGITIQVHAPDADVRFPLNLNDSDLDSAMTELPAPRTGWTEMTLAMSMYRITRMMRLLQEMTAAKSATPLTEERRLALVREHAAYVESLLSQCNLFVPVQRITKKMVSVVLLKYDFVSRLQLVSATQDASKRHELPHATDEAIDVACRIIEIAHDIQVDEFLQNFRWAGEIYPQYHIILYLLWHLCVRPSGGHVDRAWAAVANAFDSETDRQRRQQTAGGMARYNPKWAVLTALRDKALRIRARAAGGEPSNNAVGERGARAAEAVRSAWPVPSVVMAVEPSVVAPEPPRETAATDAEPHMDWDSFLDWNMVASDFQATAFAFAPGL